MPIKIWCIFYQFAMMEKFWKQFWILIPFFQMKGHFRSWRCLGGRASVGTTYPLASTFVRGHWRSLHSADCCCSTLESRCNTTPCETVCGRGVVKIRDADVWQIAGACVVSARVVGARVIGARVVSAVGSRDIVSSSIRVNINGGTILERWYLV